MLLLVATAAGADIVEWRDAAGVQHFTNVEAEVPAAYRQTTQTIVDERVWRAPAEASEQPSSGAKANEPERTAAVVYDSPPAAEAYLAGLERGLQLVRAARGGDVTISGPLAVATSAAGGDHSGYWLPARGYPLVTTSFDRGRSRHRTLRMLLQDQFAIDEDGPYVFEDVFHPAPLGVALNPFLPRGLPHGIPRHVRVITR